MELIVTQWDVNSLAASVQGLYELELIVTQWDVNMLEKYTVEEIRSELIVTQWDVNNNPSCISMLFI